MNTLPIATLNDCRSPVSAVHQVTFDKLAGLFKEPKIGAKDGTAWMPADIEVGPRTGERVKSISFLVLDVEADAEPVKDENGELLRDKHGDIVKRVFGPEPPLFDEMLAELSLHGWRGFLHTSYSHGGAILPEGIEHPRYRLAFDLSRPIQSGEIKSLGLHVAALLGIADCFDKGCLEPARLYYAPRCPEERKPLYRHAVIEGEPLDVDALLADVARIEQAQKSAAAGRRGQASGSVIQAFNDAHDVGLILEQHGYTRKGRRRWIWPGSTTGMPGVRMLPDSTPERVYSSHGGDPLNDGKAHDAFDCWRILNHGGDMAAAVKEAARLLGMGGRRSDYSGVGGTEHHVQNTEATKGGGGQESAVLIQQAGGDSPIRIDPITTEELQSARLTPRAILPELLYADVRNRISAGGTGKTTVALYEAIRLAAGMELWGRHPAQSVRTAIVTREDSREVLVARMREIMAGMMLEPWEIVPILDNIRIIDVSGVAFRLSAINDDVVVPHAANINWLIDALDNWKPDWLIFDPLVSFGVGESRVNDAEQGLIEAFRVLRNRLDCCVEGIHHSGKANARDKTLDQYGGRGGSALPDGSRMVAVMQPLTADEWLKATGGLLGQDESGIVMALPKLSYCGPQPPIFIRRRGYQFSMASVSTVSPEENARAIEDQLLRFISSEYSEGRRYSTQDLENSREKLSLSRQEIRGAITGLKIAGRILYEQVKGKAGSHYRPVTVADGGGDTLQDSAIVGGVEK